MPPTLEEYEAFIYSLPARYPSIQHALLNFIRLGPLTATVQAEIFFLQEIVLRVRQTLDFAEGVFLHRQPFPQQNGGGAEVIGKRKPITVKRRRDVRVAVLSA